MPKTLPPTNREAIMHVLESVTLDTLTDQEFERVAKLYKLDELKEELSGRVKNSRFNRDECLKLFLKVKAVSEHTRKQYTRCLTHFFSFIDAGDIGPLEVTAGDVDRYVLLLKAQEKAAASIRVIIASISSFYSYLVRLEDIKRNPFLGCPLPPPDQNMPRVPESYELEYIKLAFEKDLTATGKGSFNKRKSARTMLGCIELVEQTGFRIGTLPTLKIKENGSYTGRAKGRYGGKHINGILPRDIVIQLKNYKLDITKLNIKTLQKNFERKMVELFGENRFSWHSLRHYFAVTHYREHKDILLLKRLLHHSSLTQTQSYLRSLGINENEWQKKVV